LSSTINGVEKISKSKPDVVHVHRIELQQKERELIEGALGAYKFERYTKPVIDLISDNTAMLIIIGAIMLWLDDVLIALGFDLDELPIDLTFPQIMDWLEPQNLAGATVGGVTGLILGGILGSVFGVKGAVVGSAVGGVGGAVAGSAAVEGVEWYVGWDDLTPKQKELITEKAKIAHIIWFREQGRKFRENPLHGVTPIAAPYQP